MSTVFQEPQALISGRLRRLVLFLPLLIGVASVTADLRPAVSEDAGNAEAVQAVRDATVQIRMCIPVAVARFECVDGLGTLVGRPGERLLVTHDHWGRYVTEAVLVEFLDADGALSLELDGDTFRRLVRFRDGGTMIVQAPTALQPQGVAALDNEAAGRGDVVLVVHQRPGDEDTVSVLEAVVLAVETMEGRPVYRLQTANGEAIVRGDSGGGVWHDGRLVGNLWARELIAPDTATDVGLAAVYPLGLGEVTGRQPATVGIDQLEN
ncbi:MAG: hypothetical protein AB1791_18600 [Chloroflexota bacterium]